MNELSEIEKSGVFDMTWLEDTCKQAREYQSSKSMLMGLQQICHRNAPYYDEISLLVQIYGGNFK